MRPYSISSVFRRDTTRICSLTRIDANRSGGGPPAPPPPPALAALFFDPPPNMPPPRKKEEEKGRTKHRLVPRKVRSASLQISFTRQGRGGSRTLGEDINIRHKRIVKHSAPDTSHMQRSMHDPNRFRLDQSDWSCPRLGALASAILLVHYMGVFYNG